MFVARFANLSLARYLTNPRVIASLAALKGVLEPRLFTEILLFWATLNLERRTNDKQDDMNRIKIALKSSTITNLSFTV